MAFSKGFLLVLAFQLLCLVTCSLVQLKNNGYEDLVIAINPGLPEDLNIIENIKKMVTEASPYLFDATKKRAFFKTVKILVPLTWTPDPTYTRPKTESYEKADVIVADPFLKYGDDPYTLQYGGCGEPGKYIHFTPNFMTNASVLPVYGSRGRVLVHEWAHLRWGVFDEYNSDRPFYITTDFNGKVNVEATRCSKDVQGSHKFIDCRGTSCTSRPCQYDMSTGLFEDGCTFFPDTTQNTPASIMYMQALSTVVEFCDSTTHNIDAPNLQNRMCNYNSTWDVIMGSADWTSNPPMSSSAPPFTPSFSVLQSGDRVLCLVLDTSGSMGGNDRMNRMKQAAVLFLLQIIEMGSYVGIVTFESSAVIKSNLRQITNDNDRKALVSFLPTSPGGGTNICAGIRMGFQVNKGSGGGSGSAFGTEIVLLSDGEDSGVSSCLAEVKSSGATIHAIALGPSAAKEIDEMADSTGGLKFSASDKLDSNGLIDAFSGISSGSGNLAQQSIQLESEAATIGGSQCLDKTVAIDSTVGNDTFFVVTWQSYTPTITVVDPARKVYSNSAFTMDTATKTARLQIPGTAQVGIWSYNLCNTATGQSLSMTVTTRAAKNNVPPVIVKAHMNAGANKYPDPMVVYAEVSQGYLPVIGANVTAIIEPENGKAVTLDLVDNGAGADTAKNDGVYSRYFTGFTANGRYNLKVLVQGKDKTTRLALRVKRSRALYIPGYVDNGVISQMNPPRPVVSDDDIQAKLESFSRTASGGSFVMSNVPTGPLPDIYPPSKITDLSALILDKKVDLSWTAPGGDLDQGQAASYDVKMSTNPLTLRDNFDTATPVDASSLTPKLAGSTEVFSFIPKDLELANGTIIYFAVRAVDNATLKSDVSNTAQAALFVPPLPPPTTIPTTTAGVPIPTTTVGVPIPPVSESSPSYDVIVVVVIVCCTVLLITLIISITLCILSCHRNKRKPQTGM